MEDIELLALNKELKKKRGLEDLYYFASTILGHTDMTKRTHGELCELLTKWEGRNSIYLLPRGTFKSSIITESYILWRLLKDPNLRVLIFSETYTMATKRVDALREHVVKELESLYGRMKDDGYWREDSFKVLGRTVSMKEPSLTAGGIDKPMTGDHFDIVLCDDVIGETNTQTDEQLEKVKNRFGELYSLLERKRNAQILVVGTCWDERDVYSDLILNKEGVQSWEELMEKKIHEGKNWNVYLRRAVEDGEYFFPESLGKEALDIIARGQSSYRNRCQYYNNPTMKENTVFEAGWRANAKQAYEKLGTPTFAKTVIYIDPAMTKGRRSDYTGIIVMGYLADGRRVVREAIKLRVDPLELEETVLGLYQAYKPRKIVVESILFQSILASNIRRKLREHSIFCKIEPYNPGTKHTKESRIELLVPAFRTGQILYSAEMEDLDTELAKFPNGTHDDLVDALSMSEVLKETNFELSTKDLPAEDLAMDMPIMFKEVGV